ncbi:MAG: peptidoglycan DD-metalloendopeptidase family protein [Salinivirgaceae bacterium]|nr:peptidoglycan DD-metalloendopeptidase family protein [Salinivirgaceae bacterium]
MLRFNVLLIFLFSFCSVFAQSRQELERQKIQNEKDILYTNELIAKTEKNKKDSYSKLLLINSKIKSREKIITDINNEIQIIEYKITDQQELISNLEKDYEELKQEYAKIITNYYKNRNKYSRMMFILASENVNVAFKRIKYLQQYSNYRTLQAKQLMQTKLEIEKQLSELKTLHSDKENLLSEHRIETDELKREKSDQNVMIQQLDKQKTELKKKLDEQVQLANKLQKEIEKVIAEELKKSKKADMKVFQLTPEEKKLADNFISNKSKLPWPTERGVITGFFGENPHPVLKGVFIRNDGIDISTTEDSYIRSVFDGDVTRVFVIPGAHKTVIIRHGNYLSVYSNLSEVFVKQGDKVKTKQTIGKIFTDHEDGNKSVLQFQIWKENQKLNPQDWLARIKN